MRLDYAVRRDLDHLAADLRQRAADAKNSAARRAGLMEAHGQIMAVLTADLPPINVGDEITVQWPDQVEGLPLTNLDAHFDVLEIRDGIVGFARTINRGRPCGSYANHRAPLTAVKRCSDGHRCPDAQPTALTATGGETR